MNATRCAMLASRCDDMVYRCPSGTPSDFHYHGNDPVEPHRPLVGGRICAHRHRTPEAAYDCTAGATGQPTAAEVIRSFYLRSR